MINFVAKSTTGTPDFCGFLKRPEEHINLHRGCEKVQFVEIMVLSLSSENSLLEHGEICLLLGLAARTGVCLLIQSATMLIAGYNHWLQ